MTEDASDVKPTFGRVSLDNLPRLAESGKVSATRTKKVTDMERFETAHRGLLNELADLKKARDAREAKKLPDVERFETALGGLLNELADLKKERDAREASRPKPIVWLRQLARNVDRGGGMHHF